MTASKTMSTVIMMAMDQSVVTKRANEGIRCPQTTTLTCGGMPTRRDATKPLDADSDDGLAGAAAR